MRILSGFVVMVGLFVATSTWASAPASQTTKALSKSVKLTFTNKMVKGKKTWLPAVAEVPVGSQVEVHLVNTLPDPHGFEVPGLSKPVVVGGETDASLTFTAEKKGDHSYRCHIHPTHVGGKIVVK